MMVLQCTNRSLRISRIDLCDSLTSIMLEVKRRNNRVDALSAYMFARRELRSEVPEDIGQDMSCLTKSQPHSLPWSSIDVLGLFYVSGLI